MHTSHLHQRGPQRRSPTWHHKWYVINNLIVAIKNVRVWLFAFHWRWNHQASSVVPVVTTTQKPMVEAKHAPLTSWIYNQKQLRRAACTSSCFFIDYFFTLIIGLIGTVPMHYSDPHFYFLLFVLLFLIGISQNEMQCEESPKYFDVKHLRAGRFNSQIGRIGIEHISGLWCAGGMAFFRLIYLVTTVIYISLIKTQFDFSISQSDSRQQFVVYAELHHSFSRVDWFIIQ